VSSAKRYANSLVQRGRSYMYRRKRMEPSIEALSTPIRMVCKELSTPLTLTNYFCSRGI
jgi:hypothetical protein